MIALFLSLFIIDRLRMGYWVRNGRPVTDRRIPYLFKKAGDQLGLARNITILESNNVPGPVTICIFHPVVLLPVMFTRNLSERELSAIAIHELAHIKRHDTLVRTLISFVRAVFFFHPLVWLAARRISWLAECACDNTVIEYVSEPIPYAKTLAHIADNLSFRNLLPELASGILFSRSDFFRRVEVILSEKRNQIQQLSRLRLAGIILGGIISLGVVDSIVFKVNSTSGTE